MKIAISYFLAVLMLIGGQAYAERNRNQHNPGAQQRHQGMQERQQRHQGMPDRQQRYNRDYNYRERTHPGARPGELTRDELSGLREDRREIREKAQDYRADGQLTREERRELHQDMQSLSKEVYQEKYEDELRPRPKK